MRPLDLAQLYQSSEVPKPKTVTKPQKKKDLKIDTKALQAQESKLVQDLVESPTSKNKYKNLQNAIKELEKTNVSFKQVSIKSLELIL
jgi:lipid II:glycine glycyltransferase (peptidoglycan interpeptide bridge formation enzyme)|tara:strand:- start:1835 stop:2098 length:264 start_codon:yes stop_codon:yes gene_type:complete